MLERLVALGITSEKASFARGGPTSRVEGLKVSLVMPEGLKALAVQVVQGDQRTELKAIAPELHSPEAA